jgi:hypothetical protein
VASFDVRGLRAAVDRDCGTGANEGRQGNVTALGFGVR